MDLRKITKEYAIIKLHEKQLNYRFEPRFTKENPYWKRDCHYPDFKDDFVNDLTMYGFSPFIQKSFKEQKDDPDIMKFKPKVLNQNIIDVITMKKTDRERLRKSASTKLIKSPIQPKSKDQSTVLKYLKAQSELKMQLTTSSFSEEDFSERLKRERSTRRNRKPLIPSSRSELSLLKNKKEMNRVNSKKVIYQKLIGVKETKNDFTSKIKRYAYKEKLDRFLGSNIHNHSNRSVDACGNKKMRPSIFSLSYHDPEAKSPILQQIRNLHKPDNSITKNRKMFNNQRTIFSIVLRPTNID